MARLLSTSFVLLAATQLASCYWLMGVKNMLTIQRIDPIVNPGKVAGHVHGVVGGSNFGLEATTEKLRQSECTSVPIVEDKSNYWYPYMYFQWKNGSFSSLEGGTVIYYLFDDKPGTTTAFPDNLKMLSGDPNLRTYDPKSAAQQAVTFLCLDFDGTTTRHNELPKKACPSGVRAQVNFQSCWDGKNIDSPDHKSHVAYRSGGPDSGTCQDPKYPVTFPRAFIEVYWSTGQWNSIRNQAMNPEQPFVFSNGDPTGYSYHADFFNGWDKGVLQKAVDGCNCNPYGDPQCCADKGIFTLEKNGPTCRITNTFDERTTGMLSLLPGKNPVQQAGARAAPQTDGSTPAILSPVYVYHGDKPTSVGTVVKAATGGSASSPSAPAASNVLVVKPEASAPASASAPGPSGPAPSADAPVGSAVPAPSVASSAASTRPTRGTCAPRRKHEKADNDTESKANTGRSVSKRALHSRHGRSTF